MNVKSFLEADRNPAINGKRAITGLRLKTLVIKSMPTPFTTLRSVCVCSLDQETMQIINVRLEKVRPFKKAGFDRLWTL